MAKLAAGGGGYDVVVIVSSLAQPAIKAGFVEPLDLDQVPNYQQLFEPLQTLAFNRMDDDVYGAPTFWGIEPVTVNADAIPEGDDFGLLFDPQYAGKISMWDDISTISAVANYMGYKDLWSLSDEELEAVKSKMIEQKKLVRKYWSQAGEAIELFASGEIVASNSWDYITNQLKEKGLNVRQFIPKPGIGWLDSHFIVKGTDRRELAHKYINHLLDAEMQARIGEVTGYDVTNPASKPYMEPAVWETLHMDEAPEILKDIQFWKELPRRGKYLEIWNEIKAAPVE
jgi:putative spermidine/putrescine transport system substrate-binding protein/spermidine/putrescine transport system substrate-binding protein